MARAYNIPTIDRTEALSTINTITGGDFYALSGEARRILRASLLTAVTGAPVNASGAHIRCFYDWARVEMERAGLGDNLCGREVEELWPQLYTHLTSAPAVEVEAEKTAAEVLEDAKALQRRADKHAIEQRLNTPRVITEGNAVSMFSAMDAQPNFYSPDLSPEPAEVAPESTPRLDREALATLNALCTARDTEAHNHNPTRYNALKRATMLATFRLIRRENHSTDNSTSRRFRADNPKYKGDCDTCRHCGAVGFASEPQLTHCGWCKHPAPKAQNAPAAVEVTPAPAVEVVTECPACKYCYDDSLEFCPACGDIHPEFAAKLAADLDAPDVFEDDDSEAIELAECPELAPEDVEKIEALRRRELETVALQTRYDMREALGRQVEAAGGITSLYYSDRGVSDAEAALLGHRGAYNEPANVARRAKVATAKVRAGVKAERARTATKRGEVEAQPSPEPARVVEVTPAAAYLVSEAGALKMAPAASAPAATVEAAPAGSLEAWARSYVAELAAKHPARAKKLAGSLAYQLSQLEVEADAQRWQDRARAAFDAKTR